MKSAHLYRTTRQRLSPIKRALQPPATRRRLTRNMADDRALRVLLALGLNSDANCVDVGASVGTVLEPICKSAPRGRHVAFEPLSDYADALRKRFPRVDVRSVALSAQPGTAEFVRAVGLDAYSGLQQRDYPHPPKRVERFEVKVSTLDDELPDGYQPTLVKIDVEGGEHDVILGAQGTIRQYRPLLIFEHGPTACENYGVSHADLHGLLTSLDYRILDLDGFGPYSLEHFVEVTSTFQRFNFVAKP